MKFTYETLKHLKHGGICLVKYSTVVKPELAKAGTLEPLSQLNIDRYPIFNETKTKVFFHFFSETFPVALDIDKIEGVSRIEFQFNYQFFLNMKDFMNSLLKEKKLDH